MLYSIRTDWSESCRGSSISVSHPANCICRRLKVAARRKYYNLSALVTCNLHLHPVDLFIVSIIFPVENLSSYYTFFLHTHTVFVDQFNHTIIMKQARVSVAWGALQFDIKRMAGRGWILRKAKDRL